MKTHGATLGHEEERERSRLDSLMPSNDLSVRATFTLPNNLLVYLISDPALTRGHAALNVGIGSLASPKQFRGMAHFLEHLLFLGTDAYPDPSDYDQYMAGAGGHNNAYTAFENTNYFFSCEMRSFEGALDRFAQFFNKPLFNPDFVDKERKAVNDEAASYQSNDRRRLALVKARLAAKSHPEHYYHPGNLETLANVSREDVIAFFYEYYSASDMTVVLRSPLSLKEMEKLTREKFASVIDKGRKALKISPDIYMSDTLPFMAEIVSIRNNRLLCLEFRMPTLEQYWEAKPLELFAHILGYEGKGSLLALLKKDGLALGLAAGSHSTTYDAILDVEITLTAKGLLEKNKIVEKFFSFVNLLRGKKLPPHLFSETKKMREFDYLLAKGSDGNFFEDEAWIAPRLKKHDAKVAIQREILIYKEDPEAFAEVLSYIIPEKIALFLSYPDANTDLIEPDFGTKYSFGKIESAVLKKWLSPDKDPELFLPEPNLYIPKNFDFSGKSTKEIELLNLAQELDCFFYWQKDNTFCSPISILSLDLFLPSIHGSAKHFAMADLFVKVWLEQENEWIYDLKMAGIDLTIGIDFKRLNITIKAFSSNITQVLEETLSRLTKLTIDSSSFASVKQKLFERYENTYLANPYEQANIELECTLFPKAISPRKIYDPKNGINLLDVSKNTILDFIPFMFQTLYIEGSAYGSFDFLQLKKVIVSTGKTLGASILPASERFCFPSLELSVSEEKLIEFSYPLDLHAFVQYLQLSQRGNRNFALARMMLSFIDSDFYSTLRTKEKLGYVVHAGAHNSKEHLGLLFCVQSSDFTANGIKNKITEWKLGLVQRLKAHFADTKVFAERKKVVIDGLRKPDFSPLDAWRSLHTAAAYFNGDLHYKEEIIKEVEACQLEEVVHFLQKALAQGGKIEVGVRGEKAPLIS